MNQRLSGCSPVQIHAVGVLLLALTLTISAYSVYASWHSRQSGIESSKLELTQISSELSNFQRERGRLQSQIASLQAVVLDHSSINHPTKINELAAKIVALAESSNLTIEQFEPLQQTRIDENLVQPITIRFAAPYQSVTNWLDQLHKEMPDIHVVGITVRSQSPTDSIVKSDIRLNWYIPTNDDPSQ